ncbi:MAG: PAS domain S-box protein, partial [Clostridiales bacterium]|nr:PAS domain S-box protein [Clostridiales bacterium]
MIDIKDVTEQARYAKHHKSLIDAMQSGVIQFDSEGRVITMNPAAARILGMIPELATGRPITEQLRAIKPDGTELASEEYPSTIALRTDKPVRETILGLFNAVTEEYRWINVNAVPLFHPNDTRPHQVFVVFDDITEQKKAEDQLRKSEAVLRSVLDHSGDFIYCLDTETCTYEYVSPTAEKVLGCSAETFMTTDFETLYESVHPGDRHVFEAALGELEEKNETEIRFRQYANGEYRWFSNHLTDVRDENGRILYRNGRIRDITEQVKSDEVIRYQAGLLQSISDIIISSDENNAIKSWNRAAELTFGWTEEEALGQRIDTLLKTQIIGQTFEEAYEKLLRGCKVEIETIDTCKDGRKLNIICTPQLIKDANGKITGVVGIFRDVTEKKKMEDALREKETHLRLATEAAKLGTYAFDLKKGTIFLSEELKALWGVRPGEQAELDDMAFYKGLHPDDKQPFRDKIIAANDPDGDGLIEYDYRVVLPDGSVKWLHTRGQTTFEDVGGRRVPVYAAGVVIDITERVAAENSIREMSEELQNIIDSTDDYIASVDREYRLILFNTAFGSFMKSRFGCQLQKGAHLPDMLSPEFSPDWKELLERAAAEGKYQIELSIDEGARVMSCSFNPLYDDGKLTEITVFGRDITERINSEREIIRLNTTLEKRVQERTEKLQKSISDLKNLSRIISHDLKEPIRQIGYYAEHIQSLTENASIRTEAADIKKTCGRMTRLIDGLSEFAMSSELKIKKEPVNVKKMAAA